MKYFVTLEAGSPKFMDEIAKMRDPVLVLAAVCEGGHAVALLLERERFQLDGAGFSTSTSERECIVAQCQALVELLLVGERK